MGTEPQKKPRSDRRRGCTPRNRESPTARGGPRRGETEATSSNRRRWQYPASIDVPTWRNGRDRGSRATIAQRDRGAKIQWPGASVRGQYRVGRVALRARRGVCRRRDLVQRASARFGRVGLGGRASRAAPGASATGQRSSFKVRGHFTAGWPLSSGRRSAADEGPVDRRRPSDKHPGADPRFRAIPRIGRPPSISWVGTIGVAVRDTGMAAGGCCRG